MPCELLLEIGELHQWRVDRYLAERDVHDVEIGQRASIEIPSLKALEGRRLTGRVVEVSPQALGSPPGTAGTSPGAFRIGVGWIPTKSAVSAWKRC